MRRLLLLTAGLLLGAMPICAATPTAFNIRNGSINQAGSTSYDIRFPQPSLSGNLLVIFIQYGGATTITVADDKSQTWTCNSAISGGQQVRICYFPNTTSGVVKVTVTLGASETNVGASLVQMNGIASSSPVDVSCGTNTVSGTSAPCGSMTTTVDGDAIVEFCAQDSASANVATFTAGSGFTILTNDKMDSQGSQFEVQSTHGAVNPTMTMSPGNSKTCAGAAFKANSSNGALPSGMYIQSMLDESLNTLNGFSGGTGSSTIPFPCTGGNAYFFSFIGEPNVTITGTPTDSNSNTLTSTGATVQQGGLSGNLQAWEIGSGATMSSTMTVSFTTTGSQVSGSTVILSCIVGSGGYDKRGTATGTQSVAGTQSTSSVTPTNSSGITFWVMGVTSDTVPGVNTGTFNSAIPHPVSSPNQVDQNNGWGNFAYSSTAIQTFVANTSLGGAAYGSWASTADAFFAPAGGVSAATTKQRKLEKLDQ